MNIDEEVQNELPMSKRQSWVAVMFVWIGSLISLSAILLGSELVKTQTFIMSLVAGIIGYGIIIVITIFQGAESSDLGRPTVVCAIPTFGKSGSKYLFSIIIAIALIGWFGIQSQIAGETLSGFFEEILGIGLNVKLATVIISALMLFTAVYGFKMMEYLNYISVPLMLIVICLALFNVLSNYDTSELWSYQPEESGSITSSIGAVAGGFIVGAVIAGDFTRYNKNRTDTVKSATIGIVPVGILLIIVGAVLAILTKEEDITSILTSSIKYPILAYIMLLLATWTTNITNAYSAGLALVNGLNLKDDKRAIATIISGIIGTGLALFGILDYFVTFLIILTNLVTPIAGVMIADYWILNKGKAQGFMDKQAHSKIAIFSWALGAIPGFLTFDFAMKFLPSFIKDSAAIMGVTSFIGVFISMIVYIILYYVVTKEKNLEVENVQN